MRYKVRTALQIFTLVIGGLGLFASLFGCPPPTPTPTPTPSPVACCNVPGPEEPGWRQTDPQLSPYNALFLKEAEDTLPSPCGKPPLESLDALSEALILKNLCAAPWNDAVIVLRPDGAWEEWHAVAYTDGCWTSLDRAYIGSWYGPSMKGCE